MSKKTSYLHFDGMTWPNPSDPNEVEYRMIHGGEITKGDLLVAASFMSAFRQLVRLDARTRQKRVMQIRAAEEL